MVPWAETTIALVGAYLLGSIPTALVVSRRILQVDIRLVGDGNMGARNTFHQIGPGFGVIVAIIDFTKGATAIWLAQTVGFDLRWQFVTGICAILGHDFPIFAHFKGGQGTATSLGTMLLFFPVPTLIGLMVYGVFYAVIKNSNTSLGIGGAVIAAVLAISRQWVFVAYAIPVFLLIPVKLLIDTPRRRAIALAKSEKN